MRVVSSRILTTAFLSASLLAFTGCPSGTDGDNDGGADLCADVTCAPPSATCEGEVAVSYNGAGTCVAADGSCDYAFVESRLDCASRSQTCDAGACVGGDLCANVTCPALGASCDADTAVSYTGDGSCDPADGTCDYSAVEFRNDCTVNGETCDTGTNACTVTDLCANVTCPAPADACDVDVEVTHTGDGTCVPADGSCDYTAVESRRDCTAGGGTCNAATGLCEGIDPCFGVTCDQPTDTCDVNVAVTYSGAGICTAGVGTCDFTAVETRTDCTPAGETCVNGGCLFIVPEPAAGELVITEIMQNPNAVSDGNGEWFEVLSLAATDRDLEGLTLEDNGTNSFTIATGAQVIITPGQYFVFGNDGNLATNGGLTVDLETSGFTLANGDDEVRILGTDGTTVIDEVAYDGGPLYPDPTGMAMQFGNEHDAAAIDNNVGGNWCVARDTYGDGDLGTPGSANSVCNLAPVTVTIYELNDTTAPNHPQVNVPVVVQGVVVTANIGGFMWVQEPASGQLSGLYVDVGAVDVTAAVRGSLVDLEGLYAESGPNGGADKTQLALTAITVTGPGTLPTAELLPTSTFLDPANAEPWENVLVEVRELGVTAVLQFEVSLDANTLVNDLLYTIPTALTDCDVIDFLVGPLNYSYGTFKIEPRDAADVGTITANTVSAAPGAVDISGFAFNPGSYCVAAATDVTWTNNDSQAHSVVERDPLLTAPNNLPTTPLFDSGMLSNGDTWTMSAPAAGMYQYRCRPHPSMEGRLIVLE